MEGKPCGKEDQDGYENGTIEMAFHAETCHSEK